MTTRLLQLRGIRKRIKDFVLVDARTGEDFETSHIEGSLNLDPEDLLVNGSLKTDEEILKLLKKKGLSSADKILIYASKVSVYKASKLYWILSYLGYEEAFILNGFYEDLAYMGIEAEKEPSRKPFELAKKPEIRADRDYILENLEKSIIIDARSEEEFRSKDPANSKNKRGGHIPGALNIEFMKFLDKGYYKTKEELDSLVGDLPKDKEIIVYCQSGNRASIAYLTLKEILGYEKLRMYLESYGEWSGVEDLPLAYE